MRTLTLGLVVLLVAGIAAELATVQPNEAAAQLAAKSAPAVFQVGPNMLYRAHHIPGAIYAGPGNKPEGLALLKEAVDKLPRDREILLYCGCCPWANCPNIKPAMELMKQMGFTRAKALYVENTFVKDWTEKGYPVDPPAPK